jgi:hypothetical protein
MRTRQVNKGGNDVEQEVVIIVKDDGTVIEDFATQTTLALVAKEATLALVATEATQVTVHDHVHSIDSKITACNTGAVTVADVVKVVAPTYVQATLANTTKIYDPAAGKKARIKLIDVWNSGAANITVDLRMTAAGSAKFKKTLAANTGFIVNLQHCNWEGAADEDLFINLSGAGTVDVTVMAEDIT